MSHKYPSVGLLCNVFISSEERLKRFGDCIDSIAFVPSIVQIFNLRGAYAQEAAGLVSDVIPTAQIRLGDDRENWMYTTYRLVSDKTSVEFWVMLFEDHLLMDAEYLSGVLCEMKEFECDYAEYSWNPSGALIDEYDPRRTVRHKHIYTQQYSIDAHIYRDRYARSNLDQVNGIGIISLPAILSNSLLLRVLSIRRPFLLRHPKHTPFNFEKRSMEFYWLPLRVAIPRYEVFASIDDDNRYPSSCLIARGLYPEREKREVAPSLGSQFIRVFFQSKETTFSKVSYNIMRLAYRYLVFCKEIVIRISYG